MDSNFRRNLFVGFSISFAILIVSSLASYLSIKKLLDSNKWVDHTQQVIYNLNNGNTVLLEAQASMRGYLITGKEDYLARYKDAEKDSDGYFSEVEMLTIDNPVQQKTLQSLKPLKASFFHFMADRIKQKRQNRPVFAEDIERGRELMAEIRIHIASLEKEEQKLLKDRMDSTNQYSTVSVFTIVIAALLSLLISGFYFTRIMRDFRERAKLHDVLRQKDLEMSERIDAVSAIASQISQGNYDIRIDDKQSDALGVVSGSLNAMAKSLSQSFKTLSDNEWHQSGLAGLNNAIIGEKTIEQLCSDVVNYVAEYTNSSAGAIYIAENDYLLPAAGYSFVPDDSRKLIPFGEGLTGQAALTGKRLELKDIDASHISVSYALGEIKPSHIIALPLVDIKTEGTLTLVSINGFTERDILFIDALGKNIGIALRAAQSRKRIQELLEETQAQSEELRAQHTELESMNAELEAQTEKLQASEEELRVQQEELQQTNEELSERSTLLEERNLEIQKKSEELEITTRYKSEFLANMSHELRTPLNSILLLSRLLSENNEENMSTEQVEFAKVIQSSGNGLLGLIDEILDLSKIEAGKMDLDYTDVSTTELTGNLKGLFTQMAKEKGIAFTVEDKDAPLVLRTDKMRMEQILKNLISNAVKFTSEGSVTLSVTKHPINEKLVNFTVKDTGIGIPREKQALVFEAFQQADGSTKRKYGGTGLGLSISRELAKLLHGEISLKSEPGKGSEFTLTVPVYGSAAAQVTVTPAFLNNPKEDLLMEDEDLGIKEQDNYESFRSETIPEAVDDDRDSIKQGDRAVLIVEDDINFAKSLLDFTRKRGYKGIVSVRGDHALNLALAYRPVGVLLDIQLPMKSGWEVMEDLKGNVQTKHIPVHIMSSHKVKKESLLKGAVNFLDKPVAFEQIPDVFRRIEHFINRESQKVLIVEDNPKHAQALAYFLESNNINSEIKSDINQGIDSLKKSDVDCVILDMGVPDRQAYELLENVKENPGLENLPVIVFTGKSLSMKEELKIKKYADSIIVKTAHSYQRMLDEVSLFLHLVEENKDGKRSIDKKLGSLNDILNGKKVLVVDDDVRNIYSLTKALENLKMNVITAIDGKEALNVLEQNPDTDVVLLDMMMPNMDGYETATRIRQNPSMRNLPVIAVTAKAMTGDREKCINAGASDYITKPVDVDQLLSLLRVWLYDKR
jgi:signal transduction histidine kinase/DNA-binding response OmpR family regulator/CHASE3 domain sensor protein